MTGFIEGESRAQAESVALILAIFCTDGTVGRQTIFLFLTPPNHASRYKFDKVAVLVLSTHIH